ncbi:unnamed protein product [Macrosiphum euphorbiae]|uniref:Integrase catalytic domain-containing protein n=1 Tax=Macrosiphum euphorbiae TaxID=13131 RepID=A0AAV0W9S6_9HEMI|nr:unnamed protein product [Macrosiphum euphorbiae]
MLTGDVTRFGIPEKIITDKRRQFESNLFTTLTNLLGIQRSCTTPYHPQANDDHFPTSVKFSHPHFVSFQDNMSDHGNSRHDDRIKRLTVKPLSWWQRLGGGAVTTTAAAHSNDVQELIAN